jgi:D-amino-acid dehydrogenase
LFRKDLSAEAATPWMGFRPSLPDSLPVIDRVCGGKVLLAFGHQHLGLTQAAVTAEMVVRMARPATTHQAIDLTADERFRLDRF